MILPSKTVLLPLIVVLIGMVFGAIAAYALADDPFKNTRVIDDIRLTNCVNIQC